MPYTYRRGEGDKVIVSKKGTGEVVGHTTEKDLDKYMAALHANEPKRMAAGGEVTDDMTPEKNDLVNQWITQGMSGKAADPFGGPAAPASSPAPVAAAPAPQPKPVAAPIADIADDTDDEDPDERIVDSHPGTSADQLTPYLKGQEAEVSKFGPEQEQAVYKHIVSGMNSPGMVLAKGGAGLADAIMQGVARAGSSNFLSNLEKREQDLTKTGTEMVPKMQEMNLKRAGAIQGLEKESGATPLGGSYIASLMPALKQVYPGKSDAEYAKIAQNPAALKEALGPLVDIKKAEAELQMKGLMLGTHYQTEANTAASKLYDDYVNQSKSIGDASNALSQAAKNPAAFSTALFSVGDALGIKSKNPELIIRTLSGGDPSITGRLTEALTKGLSGQATLELKHALAGRLSSLQESAQKSFESKATAHAMQNAKFFGGSADEAKRQLFPTYKWGGNGGGGGQGTFSPDVVAYAEKHGITTEQAQAVKDRRTSGK